MATSRSALLHSILAALEEIGRTPLDVRWIGTADARHLVTWPEFERVCQRAGSAPSDLVVTGEDWVLRPAGEGWAYLPFPARAFAEAAEGAPFVSFEELAWARQRERFARAGGQVVVVRTEMTHPVDAVLASEAAACREAGVPGPEIMGRQEDASSVDMARPRGQRPAAYIRITDPAYLARLNAMGEVRPEDTAEAIVRQVSEWAEAVRRGMRERSGA